MVNQIRSSVQAARDPPQHGREGQGHYPGLRQDVCERHDTRRHWQCRQNTSPSRPHPPSRFPETQGLHTVDNLLMVHCLTEAYSRPYDIATHAGIRPKTWPQKTLKKKPDIRISNRLPHGPRPLSRPADYLLVEQQVLFPVVQVLLAQLGLLPAQSLILSLI